MKWVKATVENVPRKTETGRLVVKWIQPNGFKILDTCTPTALIAFIMYGEPYEYFFLDDNENNL